MRNMSFFLTERQFLAREKDVTRRTGWTNLKAGEHFMAIRKGQGLKRGEKLTYLGQCVCVSNRRERLDAITADDCRREGFPDLTPRQFVDMFCRHMGGGPDQEVSRIEFRIVSIEPRRRRRGRPQPRHADPIADTVMLLELQLAVHDHVAALRETTSLLEADKVRAAVARLDGAVCEFEAALGKQVRDRKINLRARQLRDLR